MQTTVIGPPFAGIQDRPDERGIQIVGTSGLLPDNGTFITAPSATTFDDTRGGSHGIFLWGVGNACVVVTIHRDTSTNHMIYVASRDSFRVTADLTDLFAEDPVRDEPYWFATLARRLYFGGGQQVFVVDKNTMEPAVMTLTEGIESQTVPYLKNGSIPARRGVVYQSRMYYVLSESVNFSTHMTIDPNDPSPQVQAVNPDGSVGYGPQQVLFSDPLRPACVQWYAAWDIDDDGCEVTALVPHDSSLLILTTKGLWALSGDTTFTLSQVSKYADCIAPASAVTVGETVFWFGANAIWRLDGNGVSRVPNTDWIFHSGSDLVRKLSSMFGTADTPWSVVVRPNFNKVVACEGNGGRYYVAVADGLWPIVIEVETLASVSNVLWSFDISRASFVASVGSSGLTGTALAIFLGDTAQIASCVFGETPARYQRVLKFRFCPSLSQRVSIQRARVRVGSMANASSLAIYEIDEAVRRGGNTAPAIADSLDTQTVPGDNEEGSLWSDGSGTEPLWAGTPTSGQVRPRYVADTPSILEYTPKGVGRDLLFNLSLTVFPTGLVEQITLDYETEPAS